MRPFALALALLMPVAMDGALLAEVIPEVLVAEETSKEKEKALKEIERLEKEFTQVHMGSKGKRLSLLNQILLLQQKYLGERSQEVGLTLFYIGFIYSRQGFYNKAESFMLRGLNIFETNLGKEDPYLGDYLIDIGYLYQRQYLYQKAENYYLRALDIRQKAYGENHLDIASTFESFGSLYYWKGDSDKAENFYLRALVIQEKIFGNEDLKIVRLLDSIGNLYESKQDLLKAEKFYQRAITIQQRALEKDPENRDLQEEFVDMIFELTDLWKMQGFYKKAEDALQSILDINRKAYGRKNFRLATILLKLGDLYKDQGFIDKAETSLLGALSIEERAYGKGSSALGSVLFDLGILYGDQGLYNKAKIYFSRALAIGKKEFIPDHNYDIYGAWLYIVGLSYSNWGLHDEAEEILLTSLDIYKKAYGRNHPYVGSMMQEIAFINRAQGKYKKSYLHYRRSLEIPLLVLQRELPYLPIKERLDFAQSEIEALHDILQYAKEKKSTEFPIAKIALFYRLNRQGLLEEIEKSQSKLASLPGPQQEIAHQLRKATQRLSSINLTKKEHDNLRIKKENLEKQLYRLLPEIKPRIIEVDQVANNISRDEVLIEYQHHKTFNKNKVDVNNIYGEYKELKGKERYLAMVLKPNQSIAIVDLGLAEPIEKKIQQALIASEEGLEDAQQLWNEVGDLVIKPLKEAIGDAQTLFISPDAELNRIPFAALSSHKDGQLLSDAVDIRLLTTGRELLDLAKDSKTIKQKSLVVANPAFNLIKTFPRKQESDLIANNSSQQRSGDLTSFNWSPLPGTAKEGKAIAKLTKAQLLTKNKATALAVQEQQQAPKVLHIASHAYFLADQEKGENPLLRSGIVLAGANEPESNPKDDGYLTALEVTKLDWKGTELVVISGCESGKGDIQAGEGVYGLKRAIAVAGARSSLLSLWKVNDRATAAFMTSFYEKLKAGEGRADALAATQKEFRNHSIPGWRHPYIWAAFQLSGDWRPIDL